MKLKRKGRKPSQKTIDARRVQTLLACYTTESKAMPFVGQLMAAFVKKELIPQMVPRTCIDAIEHRANGWQREAAMLREYLRQAVAMVDASSFGGHKSYRCLTPLELKRLEEIRRFVSPSRLEDVRFIGA